MLGAVSLDDPGQRREFTEADARIVDGLVSQVAAAVEGARLRGRERESARLIEALAEIDVMVHSSLDFEEIAQRALAAGARALGADSGAIIGKEAEGWLTWNSYNFEPSVVGVRLTDDQNPHGVAALRAQRTFAVDDAYSDERVDNEFMESYGLRSVIVAPLIITGEAVACLYFNYQKAIHPFSSDEVDFATKVASSLSLALDHARLFAAEQSQLGRLRAVNDVTQLVIRTLEAKQIADAALRYLAERLGVDVVTLWTIDEPASRLQPYSVVGMPPDFFDRFQDGVSLQDPYEVATAYRERKPVVRGAGSIHDVPAAVRSTYEEYGVPLGALLVLPVTGRTVLGSVTLAWKAPRELEDDDVAFFASIVALLANAMENARLFQLVREGSERVSAILESIGDAFFAIDSSWRFTYVNPEAERVLQRSVEELIGANIWEVFPDAVGLAFHREYTRVMDTGVAVAFEEYYAPLDLWAEVRAYPSADGIAVYFTDASERRAAHQAVETERARLREVIDDVPLGITIFDANGHVLEVNEANRRLWKQDLPKGDSARDYGAGALFELDGGASIDQEDTPALRVIRTGRPAQLLARLMRSDSTRLSVRFSATPILDADGKLSRVVLISEDVTSELENRRFEDALNSIGTAVTQTLDSEEILRRLVQLACRGARY